VASLSFEQFAAKVKAIMALIQAGNFDEAVRGLQPLACAGYPLAQLLLGAQYYERGDLQAADPLLRAAAFTGEAAAMYYLGGICRRRDHDEAMARRWFSAGAARDHAGCMFEVGTFTMKDGDHAMAKFWLGRAAVAANTHAMVNLGGLLMDEDPEGSRLWWERAAQQGEPAAIQNLRMHFGGDHE
jgi:TPR repeat protein